MRFHLFSIVFLTFALLCPGATQTDFQFNKVLLDAKYLIKGHQYGRACNILEAAIARGRERAKESEKLWL